MVISAKHHYFWYQVKYTSSLVGQQGMYWRENAADTLEPFSALGLN